MCIALLILVAVYAYLKHNRTGGFDVGPILEDNDDDDMLGHNGGDEDQEVTTVSKDSSHIPQVFTEFLLQESCLKSKFKTFI